ncbi:hypothetical protein F5Y08DRAFT_345839 [Xylaria arbuscula]|nr:hypothetical protein F5Y08DRAFT_345839 [Xylaria arbuscula]
MQAKFVFLSLLFLINNVLGGGYSSALDRVWLFYAYQIDGLRDPGNQVLGWQCHNWDTVRRQCVPSNRGKNGWVKCAGTALGGRCTFSELLNFLGEAKVNDLLLADSSGKILPLKSTNPDPQETAKKVYTHLLRSKGRIADWPGHKFILNGGDGYVKSIADVTDAVKNAKQEGKKTSGNTPLFQGFADTTTKIKESRVGNGATTSVPPGQSPVNSKMAWETVDWAKTESNLAASLGSPQRARATLGNMRNYIYAPGSSEYGHSVPIRALTTAEIDAKACV